MPTPEEEYEQVLAWKANQIPQPSPVATPQDFKSKKGVTSAKDWKKAKGGTTELPLPSGHVCVVKRPGLAELLANGTIPDMLGSIVEESISKAEADGNPNVDADMSSLRKVMSSSEGRSAIFDTAARVMVACVVEPEVLYHRRQTESFHGGDLTPDLGRPVWEDIPDDERNPEALYSDEVEFEDQMFIFQFVVGGSKDLAGFRQ